MEEPFIPDERITSIRALAFRTPRARVKNRTGALRIRLSAAHPGWRRFDLSGPARVPEHPSGFAWLSLQRRTIMTPTAPLGLKRVKVIALAASDVARARHFYGSVLGLEPAFEAGLQVGYLLGDIVLMLKDDWYGKPTAEPNPRITLECVDARATEAGLRAREVTIPDPVECYDGSFLVGSFLDSEGNKLWFCSEA